MKLGLRDKPPAFPAYHTGCSLANAGNRIAESGAAQRRTRASQQRAGSTRQSPQAPRTELRRSRHFLNLLLPGDTETLGPSPPCSPQDRSHHPGRFRSRTSPSRPPGTRFLPLAMPFFPSMPWSACRAQVRCTPLAMFSWGAPQREGVLPCHSTTSVWPCQCLLCTQSELLSKRRALIHSFIHSPDTHLLNI